MTDLAKCIFWMEKQGTEVHVHVKGDRMFITLTDIGTLETMDMDFSRQEALELEMQIDRWQAGALP